MFTQVLGKFLSPESMAKQAHQARQRSLEKSYHQGVQGRPQLQAALEVGEQYLGSARLEEHPARAVVEHFRGLTQDSRLSTYAAESCQEAALQAMGQSQPELSAWSSSYQWSVAQPELTEADRDHIAQQTVRGLQGSSASQVAQAGQWLSVATKAAGSQQGKVAQTLLPHLEALTQSSAPAPLLSGKLAQSGLPDEVMQSVNQELLLLQISKHSDPSAQRLYDLAQAHPDRCGSLEKSLQLQNELLAQFEPKLVASPNLAG